jgi:alpha-tubulin suppressor-like RCC1 family protein
MNAQYIARLPRLHLRRYAVLLAVAAALAACSGGGDGGGTTPPVSLSVTGPARAVANTRYSYAASPADATVSGISWNWGDGTSDNSGAATAQKTWHKPGSFTAQLQALFNGHAASASQVVQVIGAPVATGIFHTCSLQPGGSVRCWGGNDSGQLGDGSNASSFTTTVAVTGLSNAVAVAAGRKHTCALQSGGGLRCWGDNSTGQLGNGSLVNSTTSVAVTGLSDAIAVTAGEAHACALLPSGSVHCWGSNEFGQLGNGTTSTYALNPTAVLGLTDAVALSAGFSHTCALQHSGAVRCWGDNASGQLGNGSTATAVVSPVTVSGLSDAVAVAAGWVHTCAVQASGSVRCWGNNHFGQWGDGSTVDKATPVAAQGLTDTVAVAAGFAHTCALQSSGSVRCWGENVSYGQLGDGSGVSSNTSVAVKDLTNAVALTASFAHTCALQTSGDLRCWGSNFAGQLGDGTQTSQPVPTPVLGGAVFWK